MMAGTVNAKGTEVESDPVRTMIAAEKSFAALSVKVGMREAFMKFLADDGILFRPGPVNGKSVWANRPDPGARLEWWPVFADVALSGELGYTFGPWISTPSSDLDQLPTYGYFVTIWKKGGNGEWQVALDLGITTPGPVRDTGLVIPHRAPAVAHRSRIESLLQLDRYFSSMSAHKGAEQTFQQSLAPDAHAFLPGHYPYSGVDTISAAIATEGNMFTWMPSSSAVSESLDLGYTLGTYELERDDKAGGVRRGYYVNIWRKQANGAWKVALHIRSPKEGD